MGRPLHAEIDLREDMREQVCKTSVVYARKLNMAPRQTLSLPVAGLNDDERELVRGSLVSACQAPPDALRTGQASTALYASVDLFPTQAAEHYVPYDGLGRIERNAYAVFAHRAVLSPCSSLDQCCQSSASRNF